MFGKVQQCVSEPQSSDHLSARFQFPTICSLILMRQAAGALSLKDRPQVVGRVFTGSLFHVPVPAASVHRERGPRSTPECWTAPHAVKEVMAPTHDRKGLAAEGMSGGAAGNHPPSSTLLWEKDSEIHCCHGNSSHKHSLSTYSSTDTEAAEQKDIWAQKGSPWWLLRAPHRDSGA